MRKKIFIFYIFLFFLFNIKIIIKGQEIQILTHEGSIVPYTVNDSLINNNTEMFSIEYLPYLDDPNQELDVNKSYTIHYPYGDAISIANSMSNLYNCHAFALYFNGLIPPNNISIWISNPQIYFSDGSLVEISISEIKNWDIIGYYNKNDGEYTISHTGVILDSTIKTIDGIKIRSKDGVGFLLDHSPKACSYYNDDTIIKFYRWNHINNYSYYISSDSSHYYVCQTCDVNVYENHNITYTKIDNAFSHVISCKKCSYSANESHNYMKVGSIYRCLDCRFISSFQIITPNSRNINEIKFICSYDEEQNLMTYAEMVYYLISNNYNDLLNEFNEFCNK